MGPRFLRGAIREMAEAFPGLRAARRRFIRAAKHYKGAIVAQRALRRCGK